MATGDRLVSAPAAACSETRFERPDDTLDRLADGGRLPVPPATVREVWARDHGTADQPTLRHLLQAADHELGAPWPQPTAHAYARYFRDGNRTEYEAAVFARQQRLTRAVVAAAVTLSDTWVDEVADGIISLCEQSSWCWPAHDNTFRAHGAVVPTATSTFVDLGAGEVVGQLAWADHLLGEVLDERIPGLRARIRHEARVRVLEPFTVRRDWHWLGLNGQVHNWNPWIHGNILVAALQLVDDPPERARLVAAVIDGIDRYVASLPADGAIDEGYSYWWNGACRAIEALDVLAYATTGTSPATDIEALRATVAFPHRMHIGGPWYLNVADGSARPSEDLPWDVLHRAAVAAGDDAARRHALAHRRPDAPVASEYAGLGRLLRALTDRSWAQAEPAEPPLVRHVWLQSTEILLERTMEGSTRGLCLAVKGGHNGENHNHNDVGSVVVALNGVPVVVDAGRPTYTAATFGANRYEIWTMQSDWHSVPVIRDTAQAPGRESAARDVEMICDETCSRVRMDLAGAYPRPDVRHWWRTACLDRAAGEVSVTDSWELDPAVDAALDTMSRNAVRYLLAGDIRHAGEGSVVVEALENAGAMVLTWEPQHIQPSLTRRDLDDPMISRVWGDHLTRLSLDLGEAATGSITVRLREAR